MIAPKNSRKNLPESTANYTPDGVALSYVRRLLSSLQNTARLPEDWGDRHPAIEWRESGLMALTGAPHGPPAMCPLPIASQANGVVAALRALAPNSSEVADISGAGLLGERAAIAGLQRAGSASPGGSCRLLATRDGTLAINLAREEDWDLLPAWLECDYLRDWDDLARMLADKDAAECVERGRLMGLPVCVNAPPRSEPVPWFHATEGAPGSPLRHHPPRVIDLSSLWAGPLCSRLLQMLGAEVIKVESTQRPDGARLGPPEFFKRMNADKHERVIDFQSARGRAELRELIEQADIVIEASRPRALRQLGIDAESLVQTQPGLTWVSITGYGRNSPESDWVAFGDDAGVAAGLSWVMQVASGEQLICGDAIADPLTGMHAALAAWASYRQGGGRLLSLPMRDVVTHCIQHDLPESDDAIRARQQAWCSRTGAYASKKTGATS